MPGPWTQRATIMTATIIACMQNPATAIDDKHIVVIFAVALIAYLATCGRRPQAQCPRCKEVNRPQAVFCSQCGTRLPGK